MFCQQQVFQFFVEQVYEDQVKTVFRKILQCITAYVGGLRVIERRQLVADVNYIKLFIHFQQLSLCGANQEILLANIAGESDDQID